MMRVAVFADIGQPVYHVGDEAIGHAVHAELRQRGLRPLLFTRNVWHTRSYMGPTDAAATLPFPWPPAERDALLAHVEGLLAADAHPGENSPARRFVDALGSADAVLIAGGGNLNSEYGWLLHERLAAAAAAHAQGSPFAVTGQTLGPHLTDHDRAEATRILAPASSLCFREHSSASLARTLWPAPAPVLEGMDDAAAWRVHGPAPLPTDEADSLLATLAPPPGGVSHAEAAARWAHLLDTFAARNHVTIRLLPHQARPGAHDGDEAFHDAIVSASQSGRLVSLPLPTAAEAADAVQAAGFVITTRYHPAVFAATRCVPMAAFAPDHYADVRIDGALTHHGLDGWTPPVDALHDDAGAELLQALWDERARVREHLVAHHDVLMAQHRSRWDALAHTLQGASPDVTPWQHAPHLEAPEVITRARADTLALLQERFAAKQAWLEELRAGHES